MKKQFFSFLTFISIALGAAYATVHPETKQCPLKVEQSFKNFKLKGAILKPVQKDTTPSAGYFSLHNNGDKSLVITKITSDIAKKIELHTTEIDNKGVMHMERMDQLAVPADGKIHFKPKGNHLMLFNVQQDLKENDFHTLDFHFNDGSMVKTKFTVLNPSEKKYKKCMQHQ